VFVLARSRRIAANISRDTSLRNAQSQAVTIQGLFDETPAPTRMHDTVRQSVDCMRSRSQNWRAALDDILSQLHSKSPERRSGSDIVGVDDRHRQDRHGDWSSNVLR
jgi:hypothetical protein